MPERAHRGRRAIRVWRRFSGVLLSVCLLLIAHDGGLAQDNGPVLGGVPPMPEERLIPEPSGYQIRTYASGLDVVWGLAFAPDGRLFITERPGRIRVVEPGGRLDPSPWKTLDGVWSANRAEAGLMGIALHPDFPEEPWVYVMLTARRGQEIVNRVIRIREEDGRGGHAEVILDDLAGGRVHDGGRIRFGPDGMLYVGTGEAWERDRAQDLDDPAGSILRLAPDGSIPADNPRPGSPIWSWGHRNVQALAWQPTTGALFAGEEGPGGEWTGVQGRDEVNIIRPGGNYGWPLVVGAPGLEGFVDPLLVWAHATPAGDLLFYDGELLPDLRGDLLMTSPGAQCLVRIRFENPSDPHRVTGLERWFTDGEQESAFGRLRALAVGPDGALYIGTSNRDGMGRPRQNDDRVLRLGRAASGGGPSPRVP